MKYEAEGAVKFELTIQLGRQPPVKLESMDGEFEVDLREWIPKWSKILGSRIRTSGVYDVDGKTRFQGYAIKVGDSFRQIVGRDLTGIPLLVGADVRAYDATGTAVRLPHAYLIEIPESDLSQ